MKPANLASIASTLVLGLVLLPAVLAHGHDAEQGQHQGHDGGAHGDDHSGDAQYPPSYFAHPEHASLLVGHIAVMTLTWFFVLPVAVMLSLAKSRYTLWVQFVFLVANAFGVVLVTIYNAQTPDLYPNNAHHKVGWIITAVAAAQLLVGLVGRVAGAFRAPSDSSASREERAFVPVPMQPSAGDGYFSLGQLSRDSHDSGQGSEPNTESLRGNSDDDDSLPMHRRKEYAGADADAEDDSDDFDDMPLRSPPPNGAFASKAARVVSSRVWKYLQIGYQIIDRIILPFGFVAFASGVVAYARFFEGKAFFNGLAHWVKGGVFFWLGLFTLGRWCGSFAEIGWAWNARPQGGRKWRPSSEFVESALICLYGCTNIFLEHLSGWGGKWTGQDLEHMSITVLFIGGGALGMLVESTWIRDLLNTTTHDETDEHSYSDEENEQRRHPRTYEFSLNPIPALVILLLGIMMSSHQQSSMISSMIHKQWGNLLTGASFARALTYVIMYLKPPKSILPSRPPTELLTSFGLISGGIIFMASSSDVVRGMVHYDLDAMFIYTVTMGLVGLLMAWEVILLALKGWAVRKERLQRYS